MYRAAPHQAPDRSGPSVRALAGVRQHRALVTDSVVGRRAGFRNQAIADLRYPQARHQRDRPH